MATYLVPSVRPALRLATKLTGLSVWDSHRRRSRGVWAGSPYEKESLVIGWSPQIGGNGGDKNRNGGMEENGRKGRGQRARGEKGAYNVQIRQGHFPSEG